jgi:hypothetical protein
VANLGWPRATQHTHAVGRIKRSIVTGVETPFAEALGLERELQ